MTNAAEHQTELEKAIEEIRCIRDAVYTAWAAIDSDPEPTDTDKITNALAETNLRFDIAMVRLDDAARRVLAPAA